MLNNQFLQTGLKLPTVGTAGQQAPAPAPAISATQALRSVKPQTIR